MGKETLHFALELHHDAEATVVRGARRGPHAFTHFALQGAMHVLDVADLIEQPKEQRSGDVVRQVADDAQAPGPGKGAEIEFERVLVDEMQRAGVAALDLQMLAKIPVDFDCVQLAADSQDGQGERAAPRANLHERLARSGIHRCDDALNDSRVVQEVLAETPPGAGSMPGAVTAFLHSCP